MTPKLTQKDIIILASNRQHSLKKFPDSYKSVDDKITLSCLICQYSWESTVRSYKNCKNGCQSCKKEKNSLLHKNKEVTLATRLLIAKNRYGAGQKGSLFGIKGEKHPCWKGGYGREKNNQSTKDYEWKNAVKKKYNYQCVVTGKRTNLVCHHLNGWNCFPQQRYNVLNGVLLDRIIHKQFHDTFKYGNNTELQFEKFLLDFFNLSWQEIKTKYL